MDKFLITYTVATCLPVFYLVTPATPIEEGGYLTKEQILED